MRLRSKFLIINSVYSLLIFVALISIFYVITLQDTRDEVLSKTENNLNLLADTVSHEFHHHVTVVESISANNLIRETLETSNATYSLMSETDRNNEIDSLNNQWKAADETDAIITDMLQNELSVLLRDIVDSEVEYYGEMFVTNKYGLVVGTSGRLSTMAHAHKYWWEGSYNEGDHLIYFDDRGYDESVENIVMGVVKVIEDDGEMIGVIKVNVLLSEMLSNHVETQNAISKNGEYIVVRESGEIVIQEDVQPLTVTLESELTEYLHSDDFYSTMMLNDESYYLGVKYLELHFRDEEVFFGGSAESIDHSQGNEGSVWRIMYYERVADANNSALVSIRTTVFIGMGILTIFLGFIYYLTIRITRNLEVLNVHTNELAQGNYDVYSRVTNNDEIGELTNNLNILSQTLRSNTTSIDNYRHEIEKREVLEQKLTEIARIDELTQIYNRRAVNELFVKNLALSKRLKYPLGFIIFDIDDFKKVNDKYGHLKGDEVLKAIAQKISDLTRVSDVFSRWGGEEFVLIAINVNKDQLLMISEKMRLAVSELKVGKIDQFTISLGATLSKEEDTTDSIISRADKALYKSKSSGKNKTTII